MAYTYDTRLMVWKLKMHYQKIWISCNLKTLERRTRRLEQFRNHITRTYK